VQSRRDTVLDTSIAWTQQVQFASVRTLARMPDRAVIRQR
jgi:hypothetical protein